MNATRLLREWESSLDPIHGLQLGHLFTTYDWTTRLQTFIEPSFSTLDLIRTAAKSDETTEAFARTDRLIDTGGPHPIRLDSLREPASTVGLKHSALPVVLGAGVHSALTACLGYHSREVMNRFQQTTAERLNAEAFIRDDIEFP